MARRLYSNTGGFRLNTDSSTSSSRSSSSRISTSYSSSSSGLKSVLESTTTSLASGPLLGVQNLHDASRYGRHGSGDSVSSSDGKLSPKPNIRRYGRTTHSKAFASSSEESLSSSQSSSPAQPPSPSSPSAPHHHHLHLRFHLPGRHHHDSNEKIEEKEEEETSVTSVRERRRARNLESADELSETEKNRRIRPRSRNLAESVDTDSKTLEEAKDSTEEMGRFERRRCRLGRATESGSTKSESNKSEDNAEEESSSLRRRRRQQRLEEREEKKSSGVSGCKTSGCSETAGLSSREDSGIVDCDAIGRPADASVGDVTSSDAEECRDKLDTVTGCSGGDAGNKSGAGTASVQKVPDVKIKIVSCDIFEDQEDPTEPV